MLSRQKLVLSPLDQHAPKVYTRMALVFPVTKYEAAIATLQAALEKTCDQIPYLKGTVVEEDLTHRKQSYIIIDPSNPAPRFIERPAPIGLPTYAELKTNRTPFPPETFPSPMIPGGLEVPVLGASYTKIEGGLVMCIATYHKVVDGGGYSEILKALAVNCQDHGPDFTVSGAVPDPEEISSRRLRILDGKVDVSNELKMLDFEAMLARHPEYMLKTKMSTSAPPASAEFALSSKNTNQVFAFSGEKIEAVRTALSDKLASADLTVNNILTAIIWAAITHIRTTRPEGALSIATSKIDFSVSGRKLVGDSLLEPPFTGNVIGYAQTELGVSELSFQPSFQPSLEAAEKLVPIMKLIASASASLDASYIESLVHLSDQNPDLSNITMSWLLNGPGDLHFISWAQQACYELDFGKTLGHPGYMRSALIKLDGVVTFLPRRRAEGRIEDMDVSVLLREDDMERLSRDPVWNSWLID
jgi:hypothetical protein